jgi:citrate lyase alpha subunit
VRSVAEGRIAAVVEYRDGTVIDVVRAAARTDS